MSDMIASLCTEIWIWDYSNMAQELVSKGKQFLKLKETFICMVIGIWKE
jgi:hypothetical protein